MSWSYLGQETTLVPPSSLYYPTYVANSPLNVTVGCLPYLTEVTDTSNKSSHCVNYWGNGVRDGDEQWDDKKPKNNDGWSSNWLVEDGYMWTGGSSNSTDVWTKFSFNVTSNQGSTNASSGSSSTPTTQSTSRPKVYTISGSNEWLGLTLWLSVLLCFIIDVIQGIISDEYPTGVYISFEHIQLLSILPITGGYFTKIVNGLFRLMRFAFFGFDVINIKSLFNIKWDFNQTNDILEYLGFESGSGFVNILAFILVGLWILLIESILYKILRFSNWKLNWWTKCSKVSESIRNWFWVGFFIRYILLGYPMIMISWITEINNYSNSNYAWSWWISIAILVFWIIVFIVSLFTL